MELGSPLVVSMTLFASIALSVANLNGGVLIYSELSSANNRFDCDDPVSEILLGQNPKTVVFAASVEPCLFPNTFDQGERQHGHSLEIFKEILNRMLEDRRP